MLGMSQNRDDASRCRYCGEKLSLIQRLSRAEFCNARHKEAYQQDQDSLAISRLQQLVIEEREAELHGRLKTRQADAGEWPEEDQDAPQAAPSQPAVAAGKPAVVASSSSSPGRRKQQPPLKGVEYEDPEEATRSREPGPPMCGVVIGQTLAAVGRIVPAPADAGAEDLLVPYKVPEFDAGAQTPRLEPAGEREFRHVVDTQAGSFDGKPPETSLEQPASTDFRFPGLRVEAGDWREALQRLRQSYAGIPPLAGLIQIAGPQTLRFEARVKSPLPQPEQPLSQPVRSYKPGLARGGAVPGLAGAIRGLGTWRTRFGSEGSMVPHWTGDTVEMTVAADWMPRYPVFYSTSPWDGEGFEAAFGLGPGRGAGQGGDGVDYVQPGNVMAVLDTIGQADGEPGVSDEREAAAQRAASGVPAVGTSSATNSGTAEGSEASGEAGQQGNAQAGAVAEPGVAAAPPVPRSRFLAGKSALPAPRISEHAEGELKNVLGVEGGGMGTAGGAAGVSSGAPGVGKGQGSAEAGRGRGPGLLKGRASGNGIGDGAGAGTGDGRGSVSIDAVAALVKAARQSDRSRAPLRDLEIRLLDLPAMPKMAAPQPWRGLVEGGARRLPDAGPIWTKAPIELRSAPLAPASKEICEAPAALPPRDCVLAKRVDAPPVPPRLLLALEAEWPAVWLRPVAGVEARRTVAPAASDLPPAVNVPPFVAPPLVFGRASQVQPAVLLPEPWVNVQERDPAVLPVALTPAPGAPAETRKPVRSDPAGAGIPRGDGLSFGRIERPGGQWVLMRGSSETATFRLALDHLGPQEARPSGEGARLGPVARHAPAPGRAAIPPSRGIVYRDLALQKETVEPWLEPVTCQFGSVRGGVWESRT